MFDDDIKIYVPGGSPETPQPPELPDTDTEEVRLYPDSR